jgi:hypothetical protein
MHHRMPPSKTGWLCLNVVIFPPVLRLCVAPRSGLCKTVTTPEIIDQIHGLIEEDAGQISAKSITAQLGISRDRVWSIIHEDLDMRKLSAKWVRKWLNVDQNDDASRPSNFPNFSFPRSKWFPIAIGDHGRNLFISLWPGDKATINGVKA